MLKLVYFVKKLLLKFRNPTFNYFNYLLWQPFYGNISLVGIYLYFVEEMRRFVLLFINFVVCSISTFAQLVVTTGTMTPTQYVQNILVGGGVTVTNVTFSGQTNQIGEFNAVNTTPYLGLNSGIIMGSGDVTVAIGPNNSGSSSLGGGNFGVGEVSVYYHLPSPEGYDPLYIERYGKLLRSLALGAVSGPERSGVKFEASGLYSKKAINLLGIKYILFKKQDKGKVWGFPFSYYEAGKFKKILEDKKYQVYENTTVFPRVFFVKNYIVDTSEQNIIDKMFDKNFDLRETAVLETDPKIKATGEIGRAEIIKYENNQVTIKTQSDSPQILILTDNYYPGWVARVDGAKTEIIRADFTFRAVPVPSGKHTVTFSYEPDSFKIGVYFALIGAIGVIGTLGVSVIGSRFSVFGFRFFGYQFIGPANRKRTN